jgi:hypothetical protein
MLFNALVTSSKMLVQASDARNRWMLTGGYESPDATPSTYEPLYAGQAKGAYSQGAIPPPLCYQLPPRAASRLCWRWGRVVAHVSLDANRQGQSEMEKLRSQSDEVQ